MADAVRRPTPAEWRSVWPMEAAKFGIGGYVLLSRHVGADGQPRRCQIKEERPRGYGFGQAAMRLSPVFRLRPVTKDGKPVDEPVRVPVVFLKDTFGKTGPIPRPL